MSIGRGRHSSIAASAGLVSQLFVLRQCGQGHQWWRDAE